jgi:hypothetical protein
LGRENPQPLPTPLPHCAKPGGRNRDQNRVKIGDFYHFLAVVFAANRRGTDNGIMIFHSGLIALFFRRVTQTVNQRSRARIINSDK